MQLVRYSSGLHSVHESCFRVHKSFRMVETYLKVHKIIFEGHSSLDFLMMKNKKKVVGKAYR